MKDFFKYLLVGVKYFIIQSFAEVFIIVLLMYLGLPYMEMGVGSESLWEIIIGVLGYYTFSKSLYYSWIYILLFSIISVYKSYKSTFAFSVLNAVLSIGLFIILMMYFYEGSLEGMSRILNPFIATTLASLLIIIGVKLIENKKTS